jgi:hypothetical protein
MRYTLAHADRTPYPDSADPSCPSGERVMYAEVGRDATSECLTESVALWDGARPARRRCA